MFNIAAVAHLAELGRRIRTARTKLHWSQEAFAGSGLGAKLLRRGAVESRVSSRLLDLVFQFGPEAWTPATEGTLPVLIQHARPDLQHGLRGVDGELTGE